MAKSTRTKEEQRHYNMSRIRCTDTTIEAVFRKALWHEGIRYRKNYKQLPGKPDIAITKYRIAVFCDGEFWHGKDWEIKKPKIQSNRDYWIAKIERNMNRDVEVDRQLQSMGWTVLRFWGKDIKKDMAACVDEVKEALLQVKIDSCDWSEDECDQ
ncbi:MAG: very short patch repair endonuclease [Oscillospiraceae bacterium]|jgi:DNA mismatch endonuclease (patch repair protein)|nr:very short patch repair endonuclease [Oscillospiraceae bacterium]